MGMSGVLHKPQRGSGTLRTNVWVVVMVEAEHVPAHDGLLRRARRPAKGHVVVARATTSGLFRVRQAIKLVSRGRAPHIYGMTTRENPETDANHHHVALARWENEGGASPALVALQPVTVGRNEDTDCGRFNKHPR
jgi:hypothetical protein